MSKKTNLDILTEAANTRHLGDSDALKMLLISAVSANDLFDVKINVFLVGSSDNGKSDAVDTILELVPHINQFEVRHASPKSILYKSNEGYSYSNKIIALDDITVNDIEIIKSLANTSSSTPSHITVINGKTKTFKLNAQPVLWISSVELLHDHDNQVGRRFFKVEVLNNQTVKLRILNMLAKIERPTESLEFINAKELLKEIMQRDQLVKIKETSELKSDVMRFKGHTDVKFFIAVIRSIAKINTKDKHSKIIYATDDDIEEARRLFAIHLIHTTNIKPSSLSILPAIPYDFDVLALSGDSDSLNSKRSIFLACKDLDTSITEKKLRTRLKDLLDEGLIEKKVYAGVTCMYKRY